MSTALKITILADNTATGRAMRGEHGLAVWITQGRTALLFDTGQGLVLTDNALATGVDLSAVQAIVLSHGHYDHTGGLAAMLARARQPVDVVAHPDVHMTRFSRSSGIAHAIGMPAASRQALAGANVRLTFSRTPTEVVPGIRTTGEIPRCHPEEEEISGMFFRDAEGRVPDTIPDDQALFVETETGTVVILGCAHAGVINTLDYIQELTGGRHLRAVIGGTHLGSADESRMDWTMERLKRLDLDLLVPLHCSGQLGFARLRAAFPGICTPAGTGSVFQF